MPPLSRKRQNRMKHSELFLTAYQVDTDVVLIAASDQKDIKGCLDKQSRD